VALGQRAWPAAATGDATLARYAALSRLNLSEIEDIIPADGSILLILRRGETASAALRQALVAATADAPVAGGTLHEIAVEYDGQIWPGCSAGGNGRGYVYK